MTEVLGRIAGPIRREATVLAGRPADLVQRASVYHHLYDHSGGNNVFPLLAAHGALWGSLHFARGAGIGRIAALAEPRGLRHERLAALEALAADFKEINRRVCVEAYAFYHLAARCEDLSSLSFHMPEPLARALIGCHAARRDGRRLTRGDKRDLFRAFFLWEQDEIVGPGVEAAVARFDWPRMLPLVLRPPVGFRYFGPATWLFFRSFDDKAERIEKGLCAFELADAAGWSRVEGALANYGVMPRDFVAAPDLFFSTVRSRVLGSEFA